MTSLSVAVFLLAFADSEPKPKLVPVGPNVAVEFQGKERRVIVKASVCLRLGGLEGVLTREGKKEHEYILSGNFDARHLHTALETAGAKAGSPVEFLPKYKPATGSLIRVQLRFEKGGKKVVVSPGDWIKTNKGGRKLASEFVFGGSKLIPNPEGKGPDYYLANYGDVICVCKMDSALMDLPYASPKALDDRIYHADTDAIPAKGTAVEVIFTVLKK